MELGAGLALEEGGSFISRVRLVGGGRRSVWRPTPSTGEQSQEGQGLLSPPTCDYCGRKRGDSQGTKPYQLPWSWRKRNNRARTKLRKALQAPVSKSHSEVVLLEGFQWLSWREGSWQHGSSGPGLDPVLTPNQSHPDIFT